MKKICLCITLVIFLLGCGSAGDDEGESNGSQYDQLSVEWVWSNEYSSISIQGVVTNNSSQTFENLHINITAYDENDNLLGVDSALLNPSTLAPNQESIFNAYIFDTTCPTDDLKLTYRFSE